MFANEVALFESDREQDVGCCCNRKQQVRGCHHGRHPKGEQPADVEWVSHDLVWSGSRKLQTALRLTQQVPPDLTQSEQVEMVDQEGRKENQSPAERKQTTQHDSSSRIFN